MLMIVENLTFDVSKYLNMDIMICETIGKAGQVCTHM